MIAAQDYITTFSCWSFPMPLSCGIHYFNTVIWPRPAANYVYAAVCISKPTSSIEDGMLRPVVLTPRNLTLRLAAPDRRRCCVSTLTSPVLSSGMRDAAHSVQHYKHWKWYNYKTLTTPACLMPALTLSNWASHISGLGPSFIKIWICRSSLRSHSQNAWMRIKNVTGASRLSNFWNCFSWQNSNDSCNAWWPWTKPGSITMTWKQSNNEGSGGIAAHLAPKNSECKNLLKDFLP
jgi:hypothetical protein